MTYDSGTARAAYILDISQVEQADRRLRSIFAGIRQEGARVGQASNIGAAPAQNLNAASQGARAFKDQLVGMIGPAALVATAIGGAAKAVQSFGEAFDFKNQLDATNQSVAAQLTGVRDSGRVFQEAQRFGEQYRITQAETAAILQNSVGVLRTSTSSVGDLEAALLRLQSRDPSKPLSEASRALRELASGDTTTIKEIFNVGAADARQMKEEITGGADAVQVLTKFLDGAGNGMDVLERRAQGVQGALNNAAIANEKLVLAQAKLANSAGALGLVDIKTRATEGLANVLNFDTAAFAEANRALAAQEAGIRARDAAIAAGLPAAQVQQAQQEAYVAKARELEPVQLAVARALQTTGDAVHSLTPVLQGLAAVHGETAGAAGVQAQAERALAGELGGVQRQAIVAGSALAAMRRIEAQNAKAKQEAIKSGIGRAADVLGGGFGEDIKGEESRIHQARLQLSLTQAKTDQQRIALLQKELARTTDVVERLNIQTQIEGLRNGLMKTRTGEMDKQLRLSESIYDSEQKRYKATLDARIAANEDAKQDILDADKADRLRNTIANARDPRIRALAQLELEGIGLADQKRSFDLAQQQATAGGAIINGKVFQSVPGAGGAPTGGAGVSGQPVSSGTASGAGGGGPTIVLQAVLPDGRVIAEASKPFLWEELIAAFNSSRGSAGGTVPL